MPGPGVEPPTSGMPSGRANHFTTAPIDSTTVPLRNAQVVADCDINVCIIRSETPANISRSQELAKHKCREPYKVENTINTVQRI